jgi:hypothetical protein
LRTLDDVVNELRRLQRQLRRRYPIREMGVFGSWVRGTRRMDSDLDVLVELGDAVGLMNSSDSNSSATPSASTLISSRKMR